MNETENRKPGWAFWTAVAFASAIILAALYPLSEGPFEWLDDQHMVSNSARETMRRFYEPLNDFYSEHPALEQFVDRYRVFWDRIR